ncbi:MAG: hypothetical protein ACO1OT_11405 [Heyndrickxia sp.]
MKKDEVKGSLYNNKEEELEISSTGYGLESVVKEQDDKKKNDNPSNCGGL